MSLAGIPVLRGPCLEGGLYSEVQYIIGNGHMGAPPPSNRMTDTCENMTFPELHWWGGKRTILCTYIVLHNFIEFLADILL